MAVGGGDGDKGGQLFAQRQGIQPRAAAVGKGGAIDTGRANGRPARDGVNQIAAVIVAIDIIAQGGKVKGDRRAILLRRQHPRR